MSYMPILTLEEKKAKSRKNRKSVISYFLASNHFAMTTNISRLLSTHNVKFALTALIYHEFDCRLFKDQELFLVPTGESEISFNLSAVKSRFLVVVRTLFISPNNPKCKLICTSGNLDL